jgi:hypothetical protein
MVNDVLTSTPDRIAADMNTWGRAQVSATQIELVAIDICTHFMSAQPAVQFLNSYVPSPNLLVLPAVNRLGLLAQRECPQTATEARLDSYTRASRRRC